MMPFAAATMKYSILMIKTLIERLKGSTHAANCWAWLGANALLEQTE
jgi:hypothetical protein